MEDGLKVNRHKNEQVSQGLGLVWTNYDNMSLTEELANPTLTTQGTNEPHIIIKHQA